MTSTTFRHLFASDRIPVKKVLISSENIFERLDDSVKFKTQKTSVNVLWYLTSIMIIFIGVY